MFLPGFLSTCLLRMKPAWSALSCYSSIPRTTCLEFFDLNQLPLGIKTWPPADDKENHGLDSTGTPPPNTESPPFLKTLLLKNNCRIHFLEANTKLNQLASFQSSSACNSFPWNLLYVAQFETQHLCFYFLKLNISSLSNTLILTLQKVTNKKKWSYSITRK